MDQSSCRSRRRGPATPRDHDPRFHRRPSDGATPTPSARARTRPADPATRSLSDSNTRSPRPSFARPGTGAPYGRSDRARTRGSDPTEHPKATETATRFQRRRITHLFTRHELAVLSGDVDSISVPRRRTPRRVASPLATDAHLRRRRRTVGRDRGRTIGASSSAGRRLTRNHHLRRPR